MQTILMPAQMRLLEEQAFSLGVPSLLLMENAARGAYAEIIRTYGDVRGKQILFLIGTGNNGGDGLALARLCKLAGAHPFLVLTGEVKTPDAQANLRYVKALGIPMLNWTSAVAETALPHGVDLIVDAVYGTGFHGELPAQAGRLFRCVAQFQAPCVAIDVPSGMDSLTGHFHLQALPASLTLALGHYKIGHLLTRSPELLGTLHLMPIGIPDKAYEIPALDNLITSLDAEDLQTRLPKRLPNAHKGDNGRVLRYMGSMGMAGAAAMAAQAAEACLRSGAGLLTFVCEPDLIPIFQTLVPNATCVTLDQARKNRPKYDVFASGCGLGQSEAIWENILSLWDREKPSVWDADALNLLARHPMNLGGKAVLTPHPGEAARLLDASPSDIVFDPLAAAFELQRRYGGTVVLKGANTFIRDARSTAINRVGSPALAKGGSGDALAGIIAALLAQQGKEAPIESAKTACLWHGMAGKAAQARLGVLSPLTGDVISSLGLVAKANE